MDIIIRKYSDDFTFDGVTVKSSGNFSQMQCEITFVRPGQDGGDDIEFSASVMGGTITAGVGQNRGRWVRYIANMVDYLSSLFESSLDEARKIPQEGRNHARMI